MSRVELEKRAYEAYREWLTLALSVRDMVEHEERVAHAPRALDIFASDPQEDE